MHLTTQRDLIRAISTRWRKQYEPFEKWDSRPTMFGPVGDKRKIAEGLDALDKETATVGDVAAIVGNESWTRLTCNECGEDVDAILTVGEEPDYESHTASLCRSCVAKVTAFVWP